MTRDAVLLVWSVIGALLVACGGPAELADAGSGDASVDAGSMELDAGEDAGAASDAGRDAGTDAGPACGPSVPCAGDPSVSDEDGNVYATVDICGQCWMAENLRVGTMVTVDPPGPAASQFQRDNSIVERYCPRNRLSGCAELGGLYQWNELMAYGAGPRGICPSGWHVPSDEEWKTLERSLGMSRVEVDRRSDGVYRGTDEGTQLLPGGAANFDAPLAGYGVEMFGHYDITSPGSLGRYWTSTVSGSNATYRGLSVSSTGVWRGSESSDDGYSARCLRD